MHQPGKKFFDYKKNRTWAENLQIIAQVGLTMAGCILFCLWVGLKIDRMLGTRGPFIAIFTLLGIIGGAVVAYRQLMEVIDQQEHKK